MSRANLRTVIVSKEIAKNRTVAERLARPYIDNIRSTKERKSSWIFSARPSSDFVKNSFRSASLPGDPKIVLVYGKLKRNKNPNGQTWLQFKGGDDPDRIHREWDFWMSLSTLIAKAKTSNHLRKIIEASDKRGIKSSLIRGLIDGDIADRARALKLTRMKKSVEADERIVRLLRLNRIGNPGQAPKKSTKKKSTKKKKAPKYIKLRSPKTMPDPGPCAWLGSIVEWSWQIPKGASAKKIDENGNAIWDPRSEWMFMWSPRYKAVVSIRRPKNMYQLAEVSRYGGAAKMFEVFMARPAEGTFEVTVPDVPIHKLGRKAQHIVYRSDKWSPKRLESDYIHPFGNGVQIYCGPTIKSPSVFMSFGGKLTLTKRGLVW